MQQQDKGKESRKKVSRRRSTQMMKDFDIIVKNKDSDILMQIDAIQELKQQLEVSMQLVLL